ncbi:MAG: DNA adenine methylase [Bacteroidetes bacterium]|nr:DNA adenine methylase [Bacteroidota bacterium]
MKKQIRTPISYYGGKQCMLTHILPLIPQHEIYTEVFFGGGAVFWAKQKSGVEVINDLNGNVINFYNVLKTDFAALKREVEQTIHSRLVYKRAMVIYDIPQLFTPVQRAWAFWVATNMGYSSQVGSWAFDYYGKTERKIAVRIEEFTDIYSERLKHTSIENNDACNVLSVRDRPNAFHFVDPPYVGANQGHYSGYTQENMNELLSTLATLKGKFMLTTYPNDELTNSIKKYGWHTKSFDMFLSASNTKQKRKIEVITTNFEI